MRWTVYHYSKIIGDYIMEDEQGRYRYYKDFTDKEQIALSSTIDAFNESIVYGVCARGNCQ